MFDYPIVYRNSWVPKVFSVFISVYAIAIFPFVFIRDEGSERTMVHEYLHFKQQKECLVLFFYLIYVFDFLKGLIKYKNIDEAYCRIRFEQEAYEHDGSPSYALNRKRFSWRNYRV